MCLRHVRFLTAGESHGQQLTIIVDGLPAGLPVTASEINLQLQRRQRGYGRGARMQIESDRAVIASGVRHGKTLGSPLTLIVPNLDWENWQEQMAVEAPAQPQPRLTRLRPGHADLAGAIKYGHEDVRNVLERASARETAARVAAGAVARRLLCVLGVEIRSHTLSIGPVSAPSPAGLAVTPGLADPEVTDFWRRVELSPVRCGDEHASALMVEAITQAREGGDTLGGTWEVVAYGLPIGLGSYGQWDQRLDGRLAAAIMSIPSVKGVEIGPAFASASQLGSLVHDVIRFEEDAGWHRLTNRAGGLEGGVTNGEPVAIRAASKPISTLRKPLPSANLDTGEATQAHVERSDVCIVPAAGVVGEAMVALVVADAVREKFGGDSVAEMRVNYDAYLRQQRPLRR